MEEVELSFCAEQHASTMEAYPQHDPVVDAYQPTMGPYHTMTVPANIPAASISAALGPSHEQAGYTTGYDHGANNPPIDLDQVS